MRVALTWEAREYRNKRVWIDQLATTGKNKSLSVYH